MNEQQKQLLLKEKEDYNYQCFDNMMNTLFDLANELNVKLEEDEELSNAEVNFLRNFDIYVDSACELNDLEEQIMIEKLIRNSWIPIEDKDVKKNDIIRYITNRSIVYKVEQDAYLAGFDVYNFSLSETTGHRAECPVNYEYYRCSSKEYGESCDTCCHWNPEDAAKVQLVDPNK